METIKTFNIDPDPEPVEVPKSIIYLHHLTGPLVINQAFLEPIDKYKMLVFEYCDDLDIVVEYKLLKIIFIRSNNITIHGLKPLIGSIDLFKTKDVNITIDHNIPYIDIEQSSGITCRVRHDETWWVIVTQSFAIQLITEQKKIYRFDVSMFPVQNYIKCDQYNLISHTTKDFLPLNQSMTQHIFSNKDTWN
jgi:hypothetical protein